MTDTIRAPLAVALHVAADLYAVGNEDRSIALVTALLTEMRAKRAEAIRAACRPVIEAVSDGVGEPSAEAP